MYFQSIILAAFMATGTIATALPAPGATVDGLEPLFTKKLPSGSNEVVYGSKLRRADVSSEKLPSGSTSIISRSVNETEDDEEDLERRQFWSSKPKYCHVDSSPVCDK